MDSFVRKYGRYVPFALTIIIIFCCALFLKDHEFSEILSYCPDNLWLAAFVILGFYGLKSLSVVFPLAAIFVCVGAIYPFWVGILLNVIGLSVCLIPCRRVQEVFSLQVGLLLFQGMPAGALEKRS